MTDRGVGTRPMLGLNPRSAGGSLYLPSVDPVSGKQTLSRKAAEWASGFLVGQGGGLISLLAPTCG